MEVEKVYYGVVMFRDYEGDRLDSQAHRQRKILTSLFKYQFPSPSFQMGFGKASDY